MVSRPEGISPYERAYVRAFKKALRVNKYEVNRIRTSIQVRTCACVFVCSTIAERINEAQKMPQKKVKENSIQFKEVEMEMFT